MKKTNINKLTTAFLALSFVMIAASPVLVHAKDDKKDKNDDHGAKSGLVQGLQLNRGMEKRLEDGKPLPPGWLKRFNGWFGHKHHDNNGTTTAQNMPKIKDVDVVKSTSTAMIKVTTNEMTTAELKFSTASPVPTNATVLTSTTLTTNHVFNLSGLSADTKYFYVLSVKDADGNVKQSQTFDFRTHPVVGTDITLPSILWNAVIDLETSSSRVVWSTNEPATSKIWISTVSPVNTNATATVSSSDLVYLHDFQVSGLASSTVHYYAITSTDAAGNVSVTKTGSFKTK